MGQRSTRRFALLFSIATGVAFAALASGPVVPWRAAWAAPATPAPVRSATDVVVRGKKTLGTAILAAVPGRAADKAAPLVAFVVDVTANVVKRTSVLRSALAELVGNASFAREIRVASLGRGPLGAVRTPEDVDRVVAAVTKKETPAVNTMAELRKTLAPLKEPAVVVYLCDWRFEDDFQVDALAQDLLDHQIVFCAVGTEAAFGRAWTDGSVDPADHLEGRAPTSGGYYPGIGRSPFGKPVPDAPWHGGDSAYPPLPYRFADFLWQTEFQKPSKPIHIDLPSRLPRGKDDPTKPPLPGTPKPEDPPPGDDEPPEDLGARLGEPGLRRLAADAIRRYPIPSGFGPYGLMRLAAVTGGRYALWSWNPGGRTRVTYDYGRCNLFAPDLRPRETILPEVAADPLAAATISAWHALIAADGIVEHTPPLDRDLKTARAIEDLHAGGSFRWTWDHPSDWKEMRRWIARAVPAVAAAREILASALAGAKEPDGDVARRRLAEAQLLAFTVDVLEFELHELDLATKDVKPDLWRTTPKGSVPGAAPRDFIRGAANPLSDLGIALSPGADDAALDPAAGERIRAARRQHLDRYKGTPFGALVDLADVSTYRVEVWEVGKPPSRGGTPSESGGGKTGPVTPPPGGGSSGGGGPTTGR